KLGDLVDEFAGPARAGLRVLLCRAGDVDAGIASGEMETRAGAAQGHHVPLRPHWPDGHRDRAALLPLAARVPSIARILVVVVPPVAVLFGLAGAGGGVATGVRCRLSGRRRAGLILGLRGCGLRAADEGGERGGER